MHEIKMHHSSPSATVKNSKMKSPAAAEQGIMEQQDYNIAGSIRMLEGVQKWGFESIKEAPCFFTGFTTHTYI